MKLKYKYPTVDEIPAEHRALYAEREGGWLLDVEGAADKAHLDEFRQSNIELLKERAEWLAHKEKLETEREAQIAQAAESRVAKTKAEMEQQLAAITGERDALHARLTQIQIDQGVMVPATKRGLRPTAIPDITLRARASIRLVDGAPMVVAPDGKPRVGGDGTTPMTLEEWVATQVSEAPHLFDSHAGSGAGGDVSGGDAGARYLGHNPFRKETWNYTEQSRLQKTNPQLAAQLRAAAA